MSNNPGADAELIERDIQRTQDQMGDTVEKLEERLTPAGVAQSVIGEDGSEVARQLVDLARRNPLPVALIAVGALWLFAGSGWSRPKRRRSA